MHRTEVVQVAASENAGPRTYGNWHRPTSAGLGGLGSVGTMLLFFSLIVIVLTAMVSLIRALVIGVVLAIFLVMVLHKDRDGRNMLSRIGARSSWMWARSQRTNLYRSGPLGRALWGTNQLPGILASTSLSEHEDSYGRRFAMLYTRAVGCYSVVIGTEPDGASLVDEEQIDSWVADWGHWLNSLADEPGIAAASVTIETSPDSGTRLRREVEMNIDPDAPAFAQDMLREVVATYPAGSSTIRAYVSLTFNAATRSGGKRRSAEEMGRDLASRLPGLTQTLQATGAGATHLLTAQEVCEVVRVAYDPSIASLLDDAHAQGEVVELDWANVGPAAHQADWDGYRHDSGYSVTWEMTGPPRAAVQAGVLAKLLAPHRDIARKRVTLLYRPIDPGNAAAIVEADLRSNEFRVSSQGKPSARSVRTLQAAQATATEEASGAGIVEFGMLVTATVLGADELADAKAAVDMLSAASRIRLRPVYGSQDSAFAGALPLGINLPKFIAVPEALREKL